MAILTGILFGVSGSYGKALTRNFSPSFLTWASFGFAIFIMLAMLLIDGVPEIDWFNLWWSVAVSLLINLFAVNLFYRALSVSPLCLTMPFTAFTPLFLLPVAYFWLEELPGKQEIAGIFLVISGAYTVHAQKKQFLSPFKILFREKGTCLMLLVAFLWAVSATAEKVAVLSSSPFFYGTLIHLLMLLVYFPYVYYRDSQYLRTISAHWKTFLIMGSISGFMMVFQFSALEYLAVSHVIAFKRAGVLVSVLCGYLFFGEKNMLKHLCAAALIVGGAILMML